MDFQPRVGEELTIDGATYQVAEHPAAPGIPYGQEGRMATVYKLNSNIGSRAFKVFKPLYRHTSDQVILAQELAQFAQLPGLSVCQRTVLTAPRHSNVLNRYPDLVGSVLMPWIVGPTWMLVVLQDRELTPEWSLYLAGSLTRVLDAMEERNAANCDLSGPNVLIPAFADGTEQASISPTALISGSKVPVEVVDVEQMYGPGLFRPKTLPAGSAGYAHRTSSTGVWSAQGDRFAGALLISEMLAWCDPQVRAKVWGESFFDPKEMQDQSSSRYNTLLSALRNRWGEAMADLLRRAWLSTTLVECPRMKEWALAIPSQAAAVMSSVTRGSVTQATVVTCNVR